MSSLQGVGIEGFHCIQRYPHSRVLEERSSTVYRGVPTVYRGVLTPGHWNRGVPLYTEGFWFPHYGRLSSRYVYISCGLQSVSSCIYMQTSHYANTHTYIHMYASYQMNTRPRSRTDHSTRFHKSSHTYN